MEKILTPSIFYWLLILSCSFFEARAQSTLEYQSGTTIEVTNGADICVDSLGGDGAIINNGTFCGNTTDINIKAKDSSLAIPSSFALDQNYPNPFNPSTKINFKLASNSFVKLIVFDLLGNEIRTLVNEEKQAGSYDVEFDASGLSSGIYFYKIQTKDFINTKKMLLMK